ncbi:MAG TPA: FAD-binding oxidoreductase [Candidatus Aminicenantes bacterium]|nr:FAD-binding oxidoreductase [Candidatus Aminicenantes bacterium]HRY65391.1 FAD-binding oxidoreductase [Candidatus Aminicenantes bacterium]HRZ72141.1 FAD-binding oxidoreductase [Candidatus Aminicenantes bacterium]
MSSKIAPAVRAAIEAVVGAGQAFSDPDKSRDYGHDEFSLKEIAREPDLVVRPGSAAEVAAVLRIANAHGIPVTPRGGATGLCGGCVPVRGGIVLSLERLDRVLDIDADNQMAVTEAGVRLSDFIRTVEEAGLYFPPHPGDESAMMGGLAATNAGGSRAVKYGTIRTYVRGLELVTPSGDVLELGGKLEKSSTGYNLMHLVIGSEGTLGVVTKLTLHLMARPGLMRSLVVPFEALEPALETVPLIMKRGIVPLAVEFLEVEPIVITEAHLGKTWPTKLGRTHLLIILDASTDEEMDRLSQDVAGICCERGAIDVFIADTPSKQDEVLTIRSRIYDAIKAGTVEILDIAVPRAEVAGHVRKVREVAARYDIWLPTFGHAADGNVHTHIMKARYENGAMTPVPESEWRPKTDPVRQELFRDCRARGGVISGEHGIGLVKKPYLPLTLDGRQIDLMRGIKKAFDPNGIMNPGKIFD